MAISDRISAMYDHVEDIYDTMALDGDTTSNKNIVNINTEIKREYKDFLANGTDTLWNNWEKVIGEGTQLSLTPTIKGKMKVDLKGNTQQNGTPTPDTPIPVQVVSGDNTINVCGKNLFEDEYIDIPMAGRTNAYLIAGTYTLASCDSNNFGKNIYIRLFDKNTKNIIISGGHLTSNQVSNFSTSSYSYYGGGGASAITFTLDNDYYVNIGLLDSDNTRQVMLVKGNSAIRTYEAFNGATYPINLPVENLLDKDNTNVLNGALVSGGTLQSGANYRTLYISCKNNTTYTIQKLKSEFFRVAEFSNTPTLGASYISWVNDNTVNSITFKTTTGNYLALSYYNSNVDTKTEQEILDSIQIEYGSKANHYTEYGTTPIELCKIGNYQDYFYKTDKWYFHKEIGKAVLDGTQNWQYGTSGVTGIASSSFQKGDMLSGNYLDGLATYFHNDKSGKTKNSIRFGANNQYIYLYLDETEYTSVNDVKNWLSTHNTIVYYVLATPTNEEITDSTLLGQLNNLYNANSYEGTTNVSQVNDDMPFILDMTMLKEM